MTAKHKHRNNARVWLSCSSKARALLDGLLALPPHSPTPGLTRPFLRTSGFGVVGISTTSLGCLTPRFLFLLFFRLYVVYMFLVNLACVFL